MFLAGSLGATANLHIRQLGLFGMIARLLDNILQKIAVNKISSEPDSSTSWFVQVRHLCMQYDLQSPLSLLLNPPTKHTLKSMVKSKVTDFWKHKYEAEVQIRTSLEFFKPRFMSLQKSHPLWTNTKCNPFESNKTLVVSKFLCGQYPTYWFWRRWSKTNPAGSCVPRNPGRYPSLAGWLLCSPTQAWRHLQLLEQTNTKRNQIFRDFLNQW